MAWSTPKTWAYKETLSSADMNTYISDNLTYLRVDDNYRKTIGARAIPSTDQLNLTSGVATKVTLNNETYDLGNDFADSKFTAPVAGYYLISGAVRYQDPIADKRYYCYIYVKGSEVASQCTGNGNNTDFHTVNCITIQYLNADDYVELYANAICGADTVDIDSGAPGTYLEVQFLHS